ncbi:MULTISPECIES: glutamate synthase subunit beta [unclassified Streptomyces]|uniref:glutamate synthase subunit beta n=1 Tax=unclassified Streptomyces TaxID=2593676 RepID=UPI00225218BD|nr:MULTISPECIES: glutamate synthase subunit beta [unclassified Streptomyces]MCX4526340.1 glutamate synthase subunit beta [Streptomyces sp. NBC_01551]MCX4543098.1 glutamate synthase subunit beta [Streptomyces sp. NBC_01565]
MTDPFGFMKIPRRPVPARPVVERLADWREVYAGQALLPLVSEQADRCMDCGLPFCHSGCPLGNLIPEWNAYAARGNWRAAYDRLHATNNFPEVTGRLCPAPCEDACVLSINADPVTIKNVEQAIADEGLRRGYLAPRPPERLSGKTVAVIGSGPAGLAAAQQLTRAGHTVAVYERSDRLGGLLRYGIPEFKLEKAQLELRIGQMREEGTVFRTGVDVGGRAGEDGEALDAARLRRRFDAVVVAVGALEGRELPVPGRELHGIHPAMEYLTCANRVQEGDYPVSPVSAEGRHVVIVGGGDTGSDCLGTALRQGALSVVQLDINPLPGESRPDHQPWPVYPKVYRISHAHEEARGREGRDPRLFASATLRFEGDAAGRVRALRLTAVEPVTRRPRGNSERVLPAGLVLLALGFSGPEHAGGLADGLGLTRDARGAFARSAGFAALGGPRSSGVFVAGDAGRGQSLVVWAIAEGRSAAAAVDRYLTGTTELPAPVTAYDVPMTA